MPPSAADKVIGRKAAHRVLRKDARYPKVDSFKEAITTLLRSPLDDRVDILKTAPAQSRKVTHLWVQKFPTFELLTPADRVFKCLHYRMRHRAHHEQILQDILEQYKDYLRRMRKAEDHEGYLEEATDRVYMRYLRVTLRLE